jgi:SAM-dependent methyltransferase
VDTSQGMINALSSKLAIQTSPSNIRPICALLEDANDSRLGQNADSPARFNLVISHLVLHHIPSLPSILKVMYNVLEPGGTIALTDFENFGPEARSFHPEWKMDGVERHGIGKGEMESLIAEAGFKDVVVKEAWKMEKGIEGGGVRTFPFLICLGKK